MTTDLSETEALQLTAQAGQAFSPRTPIQVLELFSGRIDQIGKVMDAVNQSGLHAVIYGERGVGKTSLANIVAIFAKQVTGVVTSKVNCDATDTFSSVWKKALQEITYVEKTETAGFTSEAVTEIKHFAEKLPEKIAPNDVRLLVTKYPSSQFVFVFDEFDRFKSIQVKVFTDLIKLLSDQAVPATIILVGVSDTVDKLIRDHASVERALLQIPMPRMASAELAGILKKGGETLEMTFSERAVEQIIRLSQGLPHFTHLLGLHSVRAALRRQSREVLGDDVEIGVTAAVEGTQQSVKSRYHKAVTSSRRDALFRQVLLACALTRKDELSYFQAKDVEAPLSAIMNRQYKIPAFAAHLNKFCDPDRGPILEKAGERRRYRYRFTNPLLEPFVIMNGLSSNMIPPNQLNGFA